MFIAGVNTGEKLFSGVNDTGEKFIAGVNNTGNKFFIVDTGQKKPKGLKFIAGVNDTAEKLFTVVNETADKFVNNTGEYRVLPILACQHLKMKNKQKFNL